MLEGLSRKTGDEKGYPRTDVELLAVAILALLAIPAILMAAAHVFGVVAQDTEDQFIVLLGESESAQSVASDHEKLHGVRPHKIFDGPVKGYTGSIPVRKVPALESDRRVISVRHHDDEDRLTP